MVSRMRMSRPVAVFLSVVILTAVVVGWKVSTREPVTSGRRLSEWALLLLGPAPTAPAEAVINGLGPEAAPFFGGMLHTKDSPLKKPLDRLTPWLPRKAGLRLERIVRPEDGARKRLAGAMALKHLGTNAAPALADLVTALHSMEPNVSMVAGIALAQIGPDSVPGLAQALDDPNPIVRSSALSGLSLIGPGAAPAVPMLIKALADASDRPQAALALRAVGRPAVSGLVDALSATNALKIAAMEVLGGMGGIARPAIPALAAMATNSASPDRLRAIETLGNVCPACAPVRRILEDALNDPDVQVRKTATAILRP